MVQLLLFGSVVGNYQGESVVKAAKWLGWKVTVVSFSANDAQRVKTHFELPSPGDSNATPHFMASILFAAESKEVYHAVLGADFVFFNTDYVATWHKHLKNVVQLISQHGLAVQLIVLPSAIAPPESFARALKDHAVVREAEMLFRRLAVPVCVVVPGVFCECFTKFWPLTRNYNNVLTWWTLPIRSHHSLPLLTAENDFGLVVCRVFQNATEFGRRIGERHIAWFSLIFPPFPPSLFQTLCSFRLKF